MTQDCPPSQGPSCSTPHQHAVAGPTFTGSGGSDVDIFGGCGSADPTVPALIGEAKSLPSRHPLHPVPSFPTHIVLGLCGVVCAGVCCCVLGFHHTL